MDDSPLPLLDVSRITPYDTRSLRSQIVHTWRKYGSEGVRGFLGSMVCLLLTALCFRSSWATWTRYSEWSNEEILGVTSRNEPRLEEDRMGVLSYVLASLNSHPDLLRDAPQLLSPSEWTESLGIDAIDRTLEALRTVFSGLFQAAEDLHTWHRGCCADPECAEYREEAAAVARGLDRALPGAAADWSPLAADRILDLARSRHPALGDHPRTSASQNVRSFGPLAAVWDPTSREYAAIVPALRRGLLQEPLTAPPTLELTPREARGLSAFGLLQPTIKRIRESIERTQDPKSFRILQIYWLTPDNILALWQPRLVATDLGAAFHPLKQWAAANYLNALWDDPLGSYTSPAYIDYTEHGLVVTRSFGIAPVVSPPSPGHSAVGQLAGALIVDIGIPKEWFLKLLASRSQLISVELIQITATGGDGHRIEVKHPKPPDLWFPSQLEWVKVPPERQRRIESALSSEMLRGPDFFRRVTPVKLGHRPEFLVPLARESDTYREAILVTYKKPGVPLWTRVTVVSGALFLAATIASLFYGWRASRRSSELRAKVWLMSNLQVGVLSLDEQDRVIEANDRAMEILRCDLPKAGVGLPSDQEPGIRFGDLIHDLVLMPDGNRTHWDDDELTEENTVVRLYRVSVAELRARGVASVYFARVKGVDGVQWIRASGTPILGRDRKRQPRKTFGIIEPVHGDYRIALLDRILESGS